MLFVVHPACPVLHRHHGEVGADAATLVEESRKLANRHSVTHRDRKLADERLEAVDERRTVDLIAADRIGTIGDDDRHPVLPARAQAVGHGVHERIDARADVLEIDHEHVDPVEHLRRWFPRLAVQRVHRHTASGILRVASLDHVVLHVRAIAVLRAEDGGKRDVRRQRNRPDDVLKVRVIDRRRVRHDTDPFLLECPDASRRSEPSRTFMVAIIFALCRQRPSFLTVTTMRNGMDVTTKIATHAGSTWKNPSRAESSSVSSTTKRRSDGAKPVRLLHDDLLRLKRHIRRYVTAERRDHRGHVVRPCAERVAERALQKCLLTRGDALVVNEAQQHDDERQVPRTREQSAPERDERVC